MARILVQAGAAGTRLDDLALEVGDQASANGTGLEDAAYAVVDDLADPQRACQQRKRHTALDRATKISPNGNGT